MGLVDGEEGGGGGAGRPAPAPAPAPLEARRQTACRRAGWAFPSVLRGRAPRLSGARLQPSVAAALPRRGACGGTESSALPPTPAVSPGNGQRGDESLLMAHLL